jgi:hypothetical protein
MPSAGIRPRIVRAGDKKPGDTHGQGLDVRGGYWWVVVAGGS